MSSTISWWELTPLQIREKINQKIMAIEAPPLPVFAIINTTLNNTSLRIYQPQEGNFPCILLIHGGAWVAGNLETHDNLARYLCHETLSTVISVEYLNAPEGKFPHSLEQCYEVLLWIFSHYQPEKIAIVGDSAGGNMTAALCLMVRDRKGPPIDLQVLINPATDLRCNGTLVRKEDGLDALRWQVANYLSHESDCSHPYVSPIVANNLRSLPPAVVILAEKDELKEDGLKYAVKLQEAGVKIFIYCQKGIGHLAGHAARVSLEAKESIDVVVNEIKKAFYS